MARTTLNKYFSSVEAVVYIVVTPNHDVIFPPVCHIFGQLDISMLSPYLVTFPHSVACPWPAIKVSD